MLRRQQQRELLWPCRHAKWMRKSVRKTARRQMMTKNSGGEESRRGGVSRFFWFISNIMRLKSLRSAGSTAPNVTAPDEKQSLQPRAERGSMVKVTHVGDDVENSDRRRLSTLIRKVSAPDAAGAANRGQSTSNSGQIFGIVRQMDGVMR